MNFNRKRSDLNIDYSLTTHSLSDFILQTDADVKQKKSIIVFGKHIMFFTVLSYLLLGNEKDFIVPLLILISRTFID